MADGVSYMYLDANNQTFRLTSKTVNDSTSKETKSSFPHPHENVLQGFASQCESCKIVEHILRYFIFSVPQIHAVHFRW